MNRTLAQGKSSSYRHVSARLAGGWRLLVVAALGAVASLPFLSGAPIRSIDGPLHLYRLVELDRCLSNGCFFPRWMPDLAQGYGFPLLNFYPPLAYYLAEGWHLLGFSLARSLNLTFLLASMLSAVAMYLLARDLAGDVGGVLAALLYAYAPFSLQNAIQRGGVAEVLAWALAPVVLWAFRRLVLEARARWLLLASVSYAAFLLAHHLSALTFTPLLFLAVLGTWLGRRTRGGLARPLSALALALGLSAFFALPAVFEQRFVQIDRVYASAGFDYHYFFTSWRALLSGPRQTDVTLLNPDCPRAIGWIQAGQALLGCLAAVLARSAGRRAWYLGAAAVCAALLFMMLPIAGPVWEALGILRFLQYPWRLLAPLSLVLAFLGGGVALLLPRRSRRGWVGPALAAAVALGLLAYDTSLLYAPRQPLPSGNPTVADLLEFERQSWLPSLTSNYDYLPIWVHEIPAQSPMAAQYAAPAPVSWLEAGSLPPGARVQQQVYRVNDMELTLQSPVPFRAIVNQFYFPGWRAYLDGAAIPIAPATPHGLLGVELPAGTHRLRLRFEDTPLRRAAIAVSLVALLALGVAAWLMERRRQAAAAAGAEAPAPALPAWGWALLLAVGGSYLVFKAVVLDPRDTPFKVSRLQDSQVRGVGVTTQVNFGNEMSLLGYDLPERPVAAGGKLQVALYWKALRRMKTEYSVTVQLVDEEGHLWGQKDSWHPGEFPTVRWEMDGYDLDRHALPALPGTPPGDYTIRVGVYALQSGRALDVLSANGIPIGTSFELGKVQVVRPAAPPAPAALQMAQTAGVALNPDLELLGYSVPQEPVRPGQRLRFTLFWRATRRPESDYQAVALLTSDGGAFGSRASWPAAGRAYPTLAWAAGEIVRAQYDLRIPAAIPPGSSLLSVALSGPDGLGPSTPIAELSVAAVDHRMDIPPVEKAVGANLGDKIILLGYDLSAHQVERGKAIHLRLYWQARQEMGQEYTVFTHLLDGHDRISAQHDSAPAHGDRPTTGWVKGEVVVDDHELVVRADAPAGEHRLEVGLYDPSTGERLTVLGTDGQPLGDQVRFDAVEVK